MRVGIDARSIGGNGGGDETYVTELVRALASSGPVDAYTLLLGPHASPNWLSEGQPIAAIRVGPRALHARLLASLPLAAVRAKFDVVHAQYLCPPIPGVALVTSIHDIAYEHHPQFFTRAAAIQLRAAVPLVARRSAYVLTLSEFSRRDILRRYLLDPERVVVAPCGVDPAFHPLHESSIASTRSRYDLGNQPFILSAGNLQPRKNLGGLIEAYVRLRRAGITQHRLVLVGRAAWLYDDIFAAARASGYTDDILFVGYVPKDDLVALYNAAEAFVYPSFFEGFGLPPLEALACGTPVVASNAAAIPEVVGDAAVLVDPYSPDAIAEGITRVITDAGVSRRLRVAGPPRAARFDWARTAHLIRTVYERAAQENRERCHASC